MTGFQELSFGHHILIVTHTHKCDLLLLELNVYTSLPINQSSFVTDYMKILSYKIKLQLMHKREICE